jgi:hypothetical protein
MKQLFPMWPLLSIALLWSLSGCGLIRSAVRANETERLRNLEAAGDYEALAETCAKPRRYEACKAKKRVGSKRLAASTCDDILENIEAYYRNHDATKKADLALGRKVVTCGHTTKLFDGTVRLRYHRTTLQKLDGDELFDAFVAYVKSQQSAWDWDDRGYFVSALSKWLGSSGEPGRCPRVHAQLDHVAAAQHGAFLRAFHQLGCEEESTPMALADLSHDAAHRRALACEVLGDFGGADVLPKLEALAETDPYSEAHEVRSQRHDAVIAVDKVYPVRERCLEAAGKVRLRK